jgi:hypothetical protein
MPVVDNISLAVSFDPTPTKKKRQMEGHNDRNVKRINLQRHMSGTTGLIDPLPSLDSSDEYYQQYSELVFSDCVGFYQISDTVFVAQGWDSNGAFATVRF